MNMNMNGKSVSLSALQAVDIIEVEIMWPGGAEGTGWFVTLAGPGHEKTVALSDMNAKKSIRRQAQIEAAQVNGKKFKSPEVDVEEQRLDSVTSIVSRIVAWRGLRESDEGPEVEFSEPEAVKLFMDPKLGWAFWQIVEYLADERSFTKRSATT